MESGCKWCVKQRHEMNIRIYLVIICLHKFTQLLNYICHKLLDDR